MSTISLRISGIVCAVALAYSTFACTNGVGVETHVARGCAESCSAGMNDVTLSLSNSEHGTVTITTDALGNYSFDNVWKGTYTVTPSKNGYSFFPKSRSITIDDSEQANLDFTTMISWSRVYREGVESKIYCIEQTSDCGYIMCGMIDSSAAYGSSSAVNMDFWVVKLDRYGEVQWEWIDGSQNEDCAYSVHQNADGTYVVAGRTINALTGFDVHVILLSETSSGTIEAYSTDFDGGSPGLPGVPGVHDEGRSVIYSESKGEFLVAGWTASLGSGITDILLVSIATDAGSLTVTDAAVFGTSNYEEAYSLQETIDATGTRDGFIVAGVYKECATGNQEATVWRLNTSFTEVWKQNYAANQTMGDPAAITVARCIRETADNCYIIAGETKKESGSLSDMWIAKLNADGTIAWEKLLDRGLNDGANSVYQTSDGGYIVGGYTTSTASAFSDYWFLKLSPSGKIQWERIYAGEYNKNDEITSVMQATDGGYIIAGNTQTKDSKDYCWVIKLDIYGNIVTKE